MPSRKTRWLVCGLAGLTLGSACKFDPHPAEGAQACFSVKRLCPDGYVCSDSGYCYTPAALAALGTGGAGAGGRIVGTGGRISAGSGGAIGTGGASVIPPVGSGGAVGSGGVVGSGGIVGSGGLVGSGGVGPVGGGPGGGAVSTGGSSTTPSNSGTVASIASGRAQGAMSGYGWISLGALDTVTDPVCRAPAGPVVSSPSCNDPAWSTANAYCVSGVVPAVSADATPADYANNWGILLAIDAAPNSGPLGQTFASVALTVTGSPSAGLRVVTHRNSDPDSTTYCASMTSGTSVPFTSFNTSCWNGLGTRLTTADVPNLDYIGVEVPSGTAAITVSGLCITGLTFTR